MRVAFSLAAVLLSAIFSSIALAETVISPEADRTEITIYRESLAMMSELRTVNLPAGRSRIEFRGVADTIVPQTAMLASLPGELIESNFDFDVTTPANLLVHSIGKPVKVVRTDPKTGVISNQNGILRAAPNGIVVEIDGKIEPLNCGGVIERLLFDDATQLLSKPTLSVEVVARAAGQYTLQLNYLATGMQWEANYVATLQPNRERLDLTAWITLSSQLHTSYINSNVHVLAGDLSSIGETLPIEIRSPEIKAACWPTASFASAISPKLLRALADRLQTVFLKKEEIGRRQQVSMDSVMSASSIASVSTLGDYKLYTLPEPTTISAMQSKQVRFLEETDVRYERVHTFEIEYGWPGSVYYVDTPNIVLRLQNKKSRGLGKPLPTGYFAVMEGGHQKRLMGEAEIKDVPVDSPFELNMGYAFDVYIAPRTVHEERLGTKEAPRIRRQVEVQLANNKPTSIKLEIQQTTSPTARILAESKRHTQKSGNPIWTFTLQPGAREVLTYTIEGV